MGKVLIDGYFLGKPYGFGRFISELCRALGNAKTGIELTVAVPSRIDIATLPRHPAIRWHSTPTGNFILWEQLTIPRLAQSLGSDLIHFPYNTRAIWTGRLPTVVTVHDLMFLDEHKPLGRPKDFIASHYSKFAFKNATSRSSSRQGNTVVAVSDTTRLKLEALRIAATTVFNTTDGFVADCMPETRPSPTRPYLFHRGGFAEHRNTGRVIEAFKAASARMDATALKIVGAPGGARFWHTEADPSIEFLPRVSDEELASVYHGSVAVIATSLFEGFGLPVIEGFGFGVPVITSNINPMMEVAGDAALLVSPTDVADIADAMVSVRQNEVLRADLVARGAARRQVFSSENMAAGMTAIYEAALAR